MKVDFTFYQEQYLGHLPQTLFSRFALRAEAFLRFACGENWWEQSGEQAAKMALCAVAEEMEKLFREALENEETTVKLQPLADKELPLMLLENEQMRRYREMAAMYGQDFKLPERPEIVLNSACAAVQKLSEMDDRGLQTLLAKHYFDIARMSARPLENEELTAFIRRSYEIVNRLAEKA